MSNYLNELNKVQRQAVECTEGPVMIIAGAGSGKTRVLTYRIAHLLKKGVNTYNILALTFTNKAAREMKDRVVQIVGGTEAQSIWIGTFHAIFARILRYEADKLDYPSHFTIYDTVDSKSLLKTIISELGLDDKIYKPGLVLKRISLSKNRLISPAGYLNDEDLQKEDAMSAKPRLGEVYNIYTKRCFKAGAMDFDDLLYKINVLLSDHPEVLKKYQQKFQYLLIDEFQDTNLLQYVIAQKLAALHKNICVVGDDAQSIYAFRGANIQNILNLKHDYSNLKIFKLEHNYRSTKNIVKAANSVIANNKQQLHKEVWTDNKEGEKISILNALTDNEEGLQVANSIFEYKINRQLANKDFAILYRTNAQSRAMEEALRKLNIPYCIYGGLSFYQRKEIKDLLAYFCLIINNNDEEALKRIINYPARGIGKRTLDRIIVTANETDNSLWYIIENLNQFNPGIGTNVHDKISEFVTMIKGFSTQIKTKNAYELGSHIASSSGILKDLYDNKTFEGLSRYENTQELLNGLKEFSEKPGNGETWDVRFLVSPARSAANAGERGEVTGDKKSESRTLDVFMQEISLLTDHVTNPPAGGSGDGDAEDDDKVFLMTVHAAKGLEFPYVYIVGVEENLFPSQHSVSSRADLEEERRLFYVALTRAQEKATLSYASTRYRWGSLHNCEPSRFLEEIDKQLMEQPTPSQYQLVRKSLPTNIPSWKPTYRTKRIKSKIQDEEFINAALSRLKGNFKKLNKTTYSTSDNCIPDSIKNIQVGMEVEHLRFGIGKVIHLKGSSSNQKATVFFHKSGQKELLLKFAKLKIRT
ncbi:MAG: UvrD-helicase domain-containing protein [Bacteroidota bacterium]